MNDLKTETIRSPRTIKIILKMRPFPKQRLVKMTDYHLDLKSGILIVRNKVSQAITWNDIWYSISIVKGPNGTSLLQ